MQNKLSEQKINNLQQTPGGGGKESTRRYLIVGVIGIAIIGGLFIFVSNFLQNPAAPEDVLQASPSKVWKIGVLVYNDSTFVELGAFQEKMVELGYKEGVDIEYVIKNAEGDTTVSNQHANEFLADESIDLIYSVSQSYKGFDKSTLKEGNLSTPTVFSNVSNFERMGLAGIYTPTMNFGLNFTAVVCGNIEFAERRMKILKEIVPNAKVFGILLDPKGVSYNRIKKLNQDAAQKLGVELKILEGIDKKELLARAKEEFTKDSVDGVVRTSESGLTSDETKDLAAHFVKAGIPFITWSHTNPAVPDYIAALANDPPTQARQAASMVHKIISGVPIDEIPIEFSANLEIHINTAVAKAAGIEIPQSVLLQADVINTKL